MAWLLRVNRIYGADDGAAVGAVFARRLRVDPAQVTRWEKGTLTARYQVLRQYEQHLGLPYHRLVSAADLVYRETLGVVGRSLLDRGLGGESPELYRRVENLLDRALGGARMSGADWDNLTACVGCLPNVFFYPQSLWNDLSGRLVAEMIIADGLGFLQRIEALSRLLGHRAGGPAVIAACAALVADTSNQVFIDLLTSLETSPHPDAARNVVDQVLKPTNDHAFRGAWWSAAAKVGNGHFVADQIQLLIGQAVQLLSAGRHPCRLAAAEFLRQTEHQASSAMRAVVRRILATDRLSRQVFDSGRTASQRTAQAIVARIIAAAMSRLPRDVLDHDPVLSTLLEEMLFHAQISRRFVAAHLIEATPYGVAVAQALTIELRRRDVLPDPAVGAAMVHAVAQLGDHATRPFLQSLVSAPGTPTTAAEAAAWAIGHSAGHSDDAFWAHAMRRHADQAHIARGIVYALGITRNLPLLRQYRLDPSVPPAARRAAGWWLNMPQHVLDSTHGEPEQPGPDSG